MYNIIRVLKSYGKHKQTDVERDNCGRAGGRRRRRVGVGQGAAKGPSSGGRGRRRVKNDYYHNARRTVRRRPGRAACASARARVCVSRPAAADGTYLPDE